MNGTLKHALIAAIFSVVVGVIVWVNIGHKGHDLGAGIAGFFVAFAITFIGPNGLTADGTPD